MAGSDQMHKTTLPNGKHRTTDPPPPTGVAVRADEVTG